MHVTITVDGTSREYQSDYDELHGVSWEMIIRDMLDESHEQKRA